MKSEFVWALFGFASGALAASVGGEGSACRELIEICRTTRCASLNPVVNVCMEKLDGSVMSACSCAKLPALDSNSTIRFAYGDAGGRDVCLNPTVLCPDGKRLNSMQCYYAPEIEKLNTGGNQTWMTTENFNQSAAVIQYHQMQCVSNEAEQEKYRTILDYSMHLEQTPLELSSEPGCLEARESCTKHCLDETGLLAEDTVKRFECYLGYANKTQPFLLPFRRTVSNSSHLAALNGTWENLPTVQSVCECTPKTTPPLPPSPTRPNPENPEKKGLSAGSITGIVFGCVAVVGVAGFGVVQYRRRYGGYYRI